MSSIVIESPSKSTWLKPVERESPKPKKLWELCIIVPSEKDSVYGRTTLKTVPETGLFCERVKMTVWTDTHSRGDFGIETDVDGDLTPGSVEMSVHMFGSSIRFDPMTCRGEVSLDGSRYDGTWTMSCMSPKTCGCDGLTGSFTLTEI